MGTDRIKGQTLRWTFDDGPTRGTTYEHVFGTDGTVEYHEVGATQSKRKPTTHARPHYELAEVRPDVYAVSYLSPQSGFTLTSVLDLDAGTVTAFASDAE